MGTESKIKILDMFIKPEVITNSSGYQLATLELEKNMLLPKKPLVGCPSASLRAIEN